MVLGSSGRCIVQKYTRKQLHVCLNQTCLNSWALDPTTEIGWLISHSSPLMHAIGSSLVSLFSPHALWFSSVLPAQTSLFPPYLFPS